MGGVVKKPLNALGDTFATISTGGINKLAPNSPIGRIGGDIGYALTGGASGQLVNPLTGKPVFDQYTPNIGGAGGFSIDPAQLERDKEAITTLGKNQYQDTLNAIDTAGKSAQDYTANQVERALPGIYENLNARHLLNSTALPQEIGRQASAFAQDVGTQQAQARLAAMQPLQQTQQQALQRGLSLEDFITNANVAKTLGSQLSPQVNNGKANTGALLQGVGAVARPVAQLALK